MKRLSIICPLSQHTGYGRDAMDRIGAILNAGHEVVLRPSNRNGDVPFWMSARVAGSEPFESTAELIIGQPRIYPTKGRQTAYYITMESTALKPFEMAMLERAEAVIVPCVWNYTSLIDVLGADKMLLVSPQGVDTKLFKPQSKPQRDVFVFGVCGNSLRGSLGRKGLDTSIAAFQAAFPTDAKVVLLVKDMPGSPLVCFDRRVEIVREVWTAERMAAWYASLDVFVSASRGEAWGRTVHEAMACGVPCIAPKYGGLADFYDEDCGWIVPHREVDATHGWAGKWCEPDFDGLVSAMQAARRTSNDGLQWFCNRSRADKFSLAATGEIFLDNLYHCGALTERPRHLI